MELKLDWNKISRNGFRIADITKEILNRVRDLDDTLPCYENECVIYHLERAIHWDQSRTKRRADQEVEGTMNQHIY